MEFRILGPVQAYATGRPVDLGDRKQRLVLAVLLLEPNQLVPLGRLVDLLWRDAPPSSARRTVQAHVSRLRTALSRTGVALIRRGPGYLLECDPAAIDAYRFRKLVERATLERDPLVQARLLRQALSLWRGPVLADAADDGVRADLCRGLTEARVTACELWVEAELSLGNHLHLVDELTDLAARHPHRQRLTGQLMRAMHRAGRTAQALDVYAAARQRLDDELGVAPSADLQRLHVAILRSDPLV